jgi:hypothetical protein
MHSKILIFTLLFSTAILANIKNYTLVVTRGDIKVDGVTYRDKVLVNGSTPGPRLEFTNGDTARITVVNKTDKNTLIHWHGLLIKNDQDGVPYVNSMPIPPKSTKIYKLDLIQSGTYWYHSHVMYQEEDGLYGSFIIKKKVEPNLPEKTIILSDLTSEKGEDIQRNIKKDGEYYGVKKGTVQSWLKAFQTNNAGTKIRNSLQRMEGMDYADIYYEKFIANGESSVSYFNDDEERRVKLRIINGSATSIYKLTFAGEYFEVVAADGLDVEPVKVKILPMSVAESYDVIVNLQKGKKLEVRATSLDNTGFASIFLGKGTKHFAPKMPWEHPISISMGEMMGMDSMGLFGGIAMNYRNEFSDIGSEIKYTESEYSPPSKKQLNPMMMKMDHEVENSDQKMDHEMMTMDQVVPKPSKRIMNRTKEIRNDNIISKRFYKELRYDLLKTEKPIEVEKGKILRTINFTLNGNMENYIWSINGIPLGPKTFIKIKKGQRVRFVMNNTTMMNHPMHLHGHFFRVMTSQGKHSVLKHTVNVAPLEQTVIEFDANEEKDWFFHCHILYHMMGGMTRIVRYENDPADKELEKAREESEEFNFANAYFLRSKNLINSNYARTESSFFSSYYSYDFDIIGNYDTDIEGEVHVSRLLTRYLSPYIGAKTEGEMGRFKSTLTTGFTWVLPLNISIDLKYQPDFEKKFELEFENEIQLTSKLQLNFEYSSTRNYYTELEYRKTKNLSLTGNYNRSYDSWGIGLGYTY